MASTADEITPRDRNHSSSSVKEPPACPECGQRLVLTVAFMMSRSRVLFEICTACDHAAWRSEDGNLHREQALDVLRSAGLLDRQRHLAQTRSPRADRQVS